MDCDQTCKGIAAYKYICIGRECITFFFFFFWGGGGEGGGDFEPIFKVICRFILKMMLSLEPVDDFFPNLHKYIF